MKKTRSERVLVTDGGNGGSRDCLAAVRALAVAGYRSSVTISPSPTRAAPSRFSEKSVRVPRADEDGYADAIRAEVAAGSYLTVVPASEASLLALGTAPERLVDKAGLQEAAAEAGIAVPPSRLFETPNEVLAAAEELDYPVVIKPSVRTYSAFRAGSHTALAPLVGAEGPVIVQPWLDDGLRAISGVMSGGRLIAASHERWLRIWPHPCGLASAAVTTEPDRAMEERLAEVLGDYEGIFCAQLSGPFLFDLNLRVHSSHPLAVAAGANLVAVGCDLVAGRDMTDVRAQPGFFYRWLEGDLRSIAKARRGGRMSTASAIHALLPRRGAAHSTESLRDPLPMLSRLAYGARRARMSEAERRMGAASQPRPRVGGKEGA